jgi:hypothetical protein
MPMRITVAREVSDVTNAIQQGREIKERSEDLEKLTERIE